MIFVENNLSYFLFCSLFLCWYNHCHSCWLKKEFLSAIQIMFEVRYGIHYFVNFIVLKKKFQHFSRSKGMDKVLFYTIIFKSVILYIQNVVWSSFVMKCCNIQCKLTCKFWSIASLDIIDKQLFLKAYEYVVWLYRPQQFGESPIMAAAVSSMRNIASCSYTSSQVCSGPSQEVCYGHNLRRG